MCGEASGDGLSGAAAHDQAAAVENGASMLDDVAPGWHRLINLPVLRLQDCEQCVCGQLGMALGWHLFPEMNSFPYQFGFDVHEDWAEVLPEDSTREEQRAYEQSLYRELDAEWQKAIKARLAMDERDSSKHPDKKEALV